MDNATYYKSLISIIKDFNLSLTNFIAVNPPKDNYAYDFLNNLKNNGINCIAKSNTLLTLLKNQQELPLKISEKEFVPTYVYKKNISAKNASFNKNKPIYFTQKSGMEFYNIHPSNLNVSNFNEIITLKFCFSEYNKLFIWHQRAIDNCYIESLGGLYVIIDNKMVKYIVKGVAQRWHHGAIYNDKWTAGYLNTETGLWVDTHSYKINITREPCLQAANVVEFKPVETPDITRSKSYKSIEWDKNSEFLSDAQSYKRCITPPPGLEAYANTKKINHVYKTETESLTDSSCDIFHTATYRGVNWNINTKNLHGNKTIAKRGYKLF